MVRLRPFKKLDIDQMLSWMEDERQTAVWASGVFSWPLNREEILARLIQAQEAEDEWALACLDEQGELIGQLYMRMVHYKENRVHLNMIVMDPTRRGQGLGTEMVKKTVEYAFSILGMQKVTLGVFDCNPGAHICYQKAGFQDTFIEEHAYEYQGEIWNRQHMAIERKV
ncbi:MAG: GNAT family N-acetyltransferase [Lachnospiraceae bacterium]|nr:GNAT family N-acetyltransferase [Lachnospiraceae bacterium]